MKRYLPLPLLLTLSLILALFAVPTLSQAAPAAAQVLAKPKTTTPKLAPRDLEDEEEDEFEIEAEEIEIEECESAEGLFEFEEETEEEEAEDEEFEIEVEECEEEVKKKPGAVTAPEACRVQQAESSITTLPDSDRLRLTVRYQTYKPSTVSLGLKLKDNKGSLKIENTTKHLSKKGVLHLTTKVSDAVMDRAAKAKEFSVSLRAPQTPSYCGGLLEQQLQSKHPVGDARVFTQRLGA